MPDKKKIYIEIVSNKIHLKNNLLINESAENGNDLSFEDFILSKMVFLSFKIDNASFTKFFNTAPEYF